MLQKNTKNLVSKHMWLKKVVEHTYRRGELTPPDMLFWVSLPEKESTTSTRKLQSCLPANQFGRNQSDPLVTKKETYLNQHAKHLTYPF